MWELYLTFNEIKDVPFVRIHNDKIAENIEWEEKKTSKWKSGTESRENTKISDTTLPTTSAVTEKKMGKRIENSIITNRSNFTSKIHRQKHVPSLSQHFIQTDRFVREYEKERKNLWKWNLQGENELLHFITSWINGMCNEWFRLIILWKCWKWKKEFEWIRLYVQITQNRNTALVLFKIGHKMLKVKFSSISS